MQILIITATHEEIQPLIDSINIQRINNHLYTSNHIHILITGWGVSNTEEHLTNQLKNGQYDLVINAGICGAYSRTFEIGETVVVNQDVFVKSGKTVKANIDKVFNRSLKYQKVSGTTVNAVTETADKNKSIMEQYNPDIETMEGAAFLTCCQKFDVSCIQLRTISNYTGPRNKGEWNIPLAIDNLNKELKAFLSRL